jgi:hypothetical protein
MAMVPFTSPMPVPNLSAADEILEHLPRTADDVSQTRKRTSLTPCLAADEINFWTETAALVLEDSLLDVVFALGRRALANDLVLMDDLEPPDVLVRPDALLLPDILVLSDALLLPDVLVLPDALLLPDVLVRPDVLLLPDVLVRPDALLLPDNRELLGAPDFPFDEPRPLLPLEPADRFRSCFG